jgi:hypothetical protein
LFIFFAQVARDFENPVANEEKDNSFGSSDSPKSTSSKKYLEALVITQY